MTTRVSKLLKSRAFLTDFRACFLPDRAKDLSPPRYNNIVSAPAEYTALQHPLFCPDTARNTIGRDVHSRLYIEQQHIKEKENC